MTAVDGSGCGLRLLFAGTPEAARAVAAGAAGLPARGRGGADPAGRARRAGAAAGPLARRGAGRRGRDPGADAAAARPSPGSSTPCARWPRTAARSSPTARWCRARRWTCPGYGWVNLHFSLLPAWRGAAPVQAALRHGDEITGAATFRLEEGLDTGPVYGVVTEAVGAHRHRGRPAGPPRRCPVPRCWRRRSTASRTARSWPAPAAGRGRLARAEGHRRRRAGRLGGARGGRRPAGPLRHPGARGVDDLPRRAPGARPGAAGRRRRRPRAQARRAARREAAGAGRAPRRHRWSWARSARSGAAPCPRRTGPAACGSRAGEVLDVTEPRDPRAAAPLRAPAAAGPVRRARRGAGPPPGRARGPPGRRSWTRPGWPLSSCSPPSACATPTPTSPCPAILRRHGLRDRDAALATELGYGTLRAQGLLDAVIDACTERPLHRIEPPLLDALRLGAYQLLRTRVPPHAAVDTTVELVRVDAGSRSAGFVNAVLRRIGEHGEAAWVEQLAPDPKEDPVGHAALAHAHPRWIAQAFADALGARAERGARRRARRGRRPARRCTCSPGPARSPPRSWRWSPVASPRRTRPTACTWNPAAATSGSSTPSARGSRWCRTRAASSWRWR